MILAAIDFAIVRLEILRIMDPAIIPRTPDEAFFNGVILPRRKQALIVSGTSAFAYDWKNKAAINQSPSPSSKTRICSYRVPLKSVAGPRPVLLIHFL